MLRRLLFVPILTAICAAELISIANYTGKHDSKCSFQQTLTGAMVNDKLYTFGGCFKVAYVVDPSSPQHNFFLDRSSHQNVTDLSQVYDIATDKWSFETKTPIPIKRSETQVVDDMIYFFNLKPEKSYSSMDMYKYDTASQSWTVLPEIPFLWNGELKSCYDGRGKVYFAGSHDGNDRNIVQILDTTNDKWSQSPIFMDKRLEIKKMICNEDHIKFIAKDLGNIEDESDTTVWYSSEDVMTETLGLFSTSYLDGSTVSDNYSFSGNYPSGSIGRLGNWVFLSHVGKTETTFYRLDTATHENVTMATLPYDLLVPFVAPVNEKEILILGGTEPFPYSRTHRNDIEKYNHKLIYTPRKHDEL